MTGSVEKVYSEALFEIASEDNTSDVLFGELDSLSQIFKSNPELSKLLFAPTVSITDKLEIVNNIFGGRISQTALNFICVLTEKNRINYLPSIAQSYKNLYNEKNNIVEIKVTTSVPLSDNLRQKLKCKLEAVYGKKVTMAEYVDEKLIGGIVINYGNTMLDGSVKAKLDKMQKQIRNIIA